MAQQYGLLKTMNLLLITLLSSSLVSSVHAQSRPSSLSFVPAASESFPACAVDCSRLHQVKTSCAASNDQTDALACFCGSGLLGDLHHSPNGTCDDSCSDSSDRETLQSWFLNQCSTGDHTKRDMDSPEGNAGHTLVAREGSPPNWWANHYQWVVMVIVLIIAFTALTVLGVWLKRRHDAKYPHLYHASGSRASSGPLLSTNPASTPTLPPGAFNPNVGSSMTEPRRLQNANTDSYASSERTSVSAYPPSTRSARGPTRLQRAAPPSGDQIREV